MLHYTQVSQALIKEHGINYVILSGRANSDWGEGEMLLYEKVFELIRACPVPLLGICAGLQLIALAYGAKMDYICSRNKELAIEKGYLPVKILTGDKIFHGLDAEITVFQQHYCEVKELPGGFFHLASSDVSYIQCIKDGQRDVYGVQFHPERYTDDYPHGRVILENFFSLS